MSLFDWFADRRKAAPMVRNAQEVIEDDDDKGGSWTSSWDLVTGLLV
jgi:hypothetical protein